MRTHVPPDFAVQPTDGKGPEDATDGTCGLSWNDSISTSWTPAPSGRCPFEYFHGNVDDHIKTICKEAGLRMMRGVFDVLLDRETTTFARVLKLTSDEVYDLYESHIGPAIDGIEDEVADVVEFDEDQHKGLVDAYQHADGSITYIVYDEDGSDANPRDNDGKVATLIQTNDSCVDIDEDTEYLGEARDRWYGGWGYGDFSCDQTAMMERYLAMFRPEILHYDGHWSAGDSSGWGYVTRKDWERWMGEDYAGPVTPEEAFDQEVSVYRQWANGEVYGGIHERKNKPEESCWGFLGYDDHKDIAMTFTDSPIVDTLH